MRESKKNEKFWQEWDAFCRPLIDGARAFDSGKPSTALCPKDLSKELDLYLQLSFCPPASGLPPGIFAETPPLLEKALAERIANAEALLTKILEKEGTQNIQSVAEFVKSARLSFQGLLLPSPPKPDDYTVQ